MERRPLQVEGLPQLARSGARVLALMPDHILALEGFAKAQRATSDDLGPVLQAQRRLCALRPDNVDDWLRYAYSCVRIDDYGEATRALTRACELAPTQLMPRWAAALTPPAAVFAVFGSTVLSSAMVTMFCFTTSNLTG